MYFIIIIIVISIIIIIKSEWTNKQTNKQIPNKLNNTNLFHILWKLRIVNNNNNNNNNDNNNKHT